MHEYKGGKRIYPLDASNPSTELRMHLVMKHTDFFDLIKGTRSTRSRRNTRNNLCFVADVSICFTIAVVEVLYLACSVQCIMKLLLTFLVLSCHIYKFSTDFLSQLDCSFRGLLFVC